MKRGLLNMQKSNLAILLVILGIFFSGCNKPEDKSKEDYEIIVAKKKALKIRDYKLISEKMCEQQLGGVSEEKNEIYIIDYLTERLKKKILVRVFDINNFKVKKVKRLQSGTYQAPNEFEPIIERINYFNKKYYICNTKVSVFNNNFDYLSCSFLKYSSLQFIDYLQYIDGAYLLLGNCRNVCKDLKKIRRIFEILIYKFNENRRSSKKFKIDEFEFNSEQPILKSNSINNTRKWFKYYFTPKIFGFVKNEKIFYSINTKPGYFIYDFKTKKKKFLKLSWLKPKNYSDKDAYLIGTFKTLDSNEKKAFKKSKGSSKVIYKSIKEPMIYFLWMLKCGKDKIAIVSVIDIDKMKMRVDFLKPETGEYIESIMLPVGQHLTRLLSLREYSIPQFYIDYDKGIYIWGDRESNREEEDWDEVVRYSRFKIK